MPILSLTALGAPFCGLLGMAWILMKTFSQGGAASGELAAVSPGVSGGLAMLVVGLIVATPALAGQILLGSLWRERVRRLGDFRSELGRAIEHFYGCDREVPLSTSSHHQPGAAHHAGIPAPHLDHYAMDRAAAEMETADQQPYASQSPFVLMDGPAEGPIAAYADAEDDMSAAADGYLFQTPFTEVQAAPARAGARRELTEAGRL